MTDKKSMAELGSPFFNRLPADPYPEGIGQNMDSNASNSSRALEITGVPEADAIDKALDKYDRLAVAIDLVREYLASDWISEDCKEHPLFGCGSCRALALDYELVSLKNTFISFEDSAE
ncbi:MAG: hypothetical protein JWR51_4698 [Devosia sp.]|uniref:hypothetical protein n=1 Tax=Devosia sp. TaxID=1871048 RepID=UPI002633860F|nr:hypothetical protein [Devosia sp.]MDB5531595.1 hypothetical protein [Devosia sp.]